MGEAFLRGLLRAQVAAPGDITVAEADPARRAALSEHGARVTDDIETACIGADLVLIAVKPQDLPEVATSMRSGLPGSAVLVSIAAGVPLSVVQRQSGHNASVRV